MDERRRPLYVVHILKICINEGEKGEPWRRFIYLRRRLPGQKHGHFALGVYCLFDSTEPTAATALRSRGRGGVVNDEEGVQKRLLNIFPSFPVREVARSLQSGLPGLHNRLLLSLASPLRRPIITLSSQVRSRRVRPSPVS